MPHSCSSFAGASTSFWGRGPPRFAGPTFRRRHAASVPAPPWHDVSAPDTKCAVCRMRQWWRWSKLSPIPLAGRAETTCRARLKAWRALPQTWPSPTLYRTRSRAAGPSTGAPASPRPKRSTLTARLSRRARSFEDGASFVSPIYLAGETASGSGPQAQQPQLQYYGRMVTLRFNRFRHKHEIFKRWSAVL